MLDFLHSEGGGNGPMSPVGKDLRNQSIHFFSVFCLLSGGTGILQADSLSQASLYILKIVFNAYWLCLVRFSLDRAFRS